MIVGGNTKVRRKHKETRKYGTFCIGQENLETLNRIKRRKP